MLPHGDFRAKCVVHACCVGVCVLGMCGVNSLAQIVLDSDLRWQLFCGLCFY